MTEKELKHLSKAELIRLVLRMESREKELTGENEKLNAEKGQWEMDISEAGSIADAVVGLSGIFQKAQITADEYLKQVYAANRDTEARCAAMLEKAESDAAEMMEKAEAESAERIRQADAEVKARWEEFQIQTERFIEAHAELKALLSDH